MFLDRYWSVVVLQGVLDDNFFFFKDPPSFIEIDYCFTQMGPRPLSTLNTDGNLTFFFSVTSLIHCSGAGYKIRI